jgi:glycosyltransferase involved in cell wall biosynthesis
MRKLLYITPHLSTGGAPQYLLKKIELLKDEYDISLVEYTDVGGTQFVVQKNRIFDIIPSEKRITLREDKTQLLDFLDQVQPNIVHLEEIPEMFMDNGIAEILYNKNRNYTIFETSHDSSQNPNNKRFFPDKFMFVSNWQIDQYKDIDVPAVLVEYPIEYKETKNKEEACKRLGLDPNKKHIVHVGLFTPRKNQAEFFEYARALPEYEFHCIGNQAINFQHYWEPLMKDKPSNLTWWGERNDVDNFYEAADLFLFTSKGNSHDKETMPLVIREAISWKLPTLIYNLGVYQNYFDKYPVEYLTQFDENINKIKSLIDNTFIDISKEAFVLSTYPNSQAVIDTTLKCIESIKQTKRSIILVSHYPIPESLQKEVDYCIYDANNILVKHNYFTQAWWASSNIRLNFNLKKEDNNWYHGPAVYTNYYNGSQLAEKLGFEKVYFLNFDYLVKSKTDFDNLSIELNRHDACLSYETNEEGSTYETFFMAFRSSYFNSTFPKISTAKEYSNWVKNVDSPTNGLEKSMYCALKGKGNHLELDKNKVHNFFNFKDFSQLEYLTVLPSNKPNIIIPSALFSDSTNSKRLVINIIADKQNVLETKEYIINHKGCFWFEQDSTINNSFFDIEFIVTDIPTDTIVKTKTIKITPEYLKSQLPQNGSTSI